MGDEAPKYDQIKDLRMTENEKDRKAVMMFYKKILPCVSGKKKFKKIMHEVTISDTVTASLEALALWIIYNYEDKWNTEGTTRESPAKFTGVTKGNKIYSGWDAAGITKFNEFMEFVRYNRKEDNGQFEELFKSEMRKEHEDRMIRKNNTTLPNDDIVCENDLDSKLADISKVIYTREPSKSYESRESSDSTSMSSQSSVSSTSYHSVQHYHAENSGTYFSSL